MTLNAMGTPLGSSLVPAQRLKELKEAGAQISMVQVYSAHRPPHLPNCEHLALKGLSRVVQRVREVTGLRAEVF